MMKRLAARLTLAAAVAIVFPAFPGCDADYHSTSTGLAKTTGLKPNEDGPEGSGSIYDYKINAGGPGAPGTTTTNPEGEPGTKAEHREGDQGPKAAHPGGEPEATKAKPGSPSPKPEHH